MDEEPLVNLEEDIFSILLRYGLFLGAIFQMVCIGACIFLPNTIENDPEYAQFADKSSDSEQLPSAQNLSRRPQYRNRKQEKKKRR